MNSTMIAIYSSAIIDTIILCLEKFVTAMKERLERHAPNNAVCFPFVCSPFLLCSSFRCAVKPKKHIQARYPFNL